MSRLIFQFHLALEVCDHGEISRSLISGISLFRPVGLKCQVHNEWHLSPSVNVLKYQVLQSVASPSLSPCFEMSSPLLSKTFPLQCLGLAVLPSNLNLGKSELLIRKQRRCAAVAGGRVSINTDSTGIIIMPKFHHRIL